MGRPRALGGDMALSSNKIRRKVQEYECRKKALQEMSADHGDRRHGTISGYSYGCRCERCRKARHDYYIEHERDMRRARHERTGRW